jgi:hypothetical protein
MAEVPFIFDPMLATNMLTAHFERVVDGIDNDRLERVITLCNKLACVEEVFPLVCRDLEYLEVI